MFAGARSHNSSFINRQTERLQHLLKSATLERLRKEAQLCFYWVLMCYRALTAADDWLGFFFFSWYTLEEERERGDLRWDVHTGSQEGLASSEQRGLSQWAFVFGFKGRIHPYSTTRFRDYKCILGGCSVLTNATLLSWRIQYTCIDTIYVMTVFPRDCGGTWDPDVLLLLIQFWE